MTATSSSSTSVVFETAARAPRRADATAVPVFVDGPVPRGVGLSRAALGLTGFDGKVGQTYSVPSTSGAATIVIGLGERKNLTTGVLRTAAAAMARAASRYEALATTLADIEGLPASAAGQAVAEGVVLASYRFTRHRSKIEPSSVPKLTSVTLIGAPGRLAALTRGAQRGKAIGDAVRFARDLINTSPGHLNARDMAEIAVDVASRSKLSVTVHDLDAVKEMRLGGLVSVNKGSLEPARLIRLEYKARSAIGTVALVGKGVMYDSGGISLKPSDAMHASMKMDMSGAAAVVAAMSVLHVVRPRVNVVGYLLCTDNMPSGSALKMGEVITIRNGKTVEIHNTDAEGRLILADGLSLAVEDGVDAIVDIATLTGACMGALGTKLAGLFCNNDRWADQVASAARRADEGLWRLPLVPDYRRLLDSEVADMKNIGGPYGGAITAALFLQEFVGDTPWAHLDMAGPMRSDTDDGWLSRGGTGFGVRTFVELLDAYEAV